MVFLAGFIQHSTDSRPRWRVRKNKVSVSATAQELDQVCKGYIYYLSRSESPSSGDLVSGGSQLKILAEIV